MFNLLAPEKEKKDGFPKDCSKKKKRYYRFEDAPPSPGLFPSLACCCPCLLAAPGGASAVPASCPLARAVTGARTKSGQPRKFALTPAELSAPEAVGAKGQGDVPSKARRLIQARRCLLRFSATRLALPT